MASMPSSSSDLDTALGPQFDPEACVPGRTSPAAARLEARTLADSPTFADTGHVNQGRAGSGSPGSIALVDDAMASGVCPSAVFPPRTPATENELARTRSTGVVTPLYAATPAPVGLADYGLAEGPGGSVVASILNTTSLRGSVEANATVTIAFVRAPPVYTVAFTESGLPVAALARGWAVELNRTTEPSTNASVPFTSRNASVEFLITGPAGYRVVAAPDGPSGALSVNGTNPSDSVVFARGPTASLTLADKGLPAGEGVCASLSGDERCTTAREMRFVNLIPATYAYRVVAPLVGQTVTVRHSGTTQGPSGELVVRGRTTASVTFAYPYAVTFPETGLTSGTWSVTVHGETVVAAWEEPIVLNLTNGTHAFHVGREPGYVRTGGGSRVVVQGMGVSVPVTFRPRG